MRNIGKTATFKRIKTITFTWIIHSSAEMPILPFSPLSLIRRPTNLGGAFDWMPSLCMRSWGSWRSTPFFDSVYEFDLLWYLILWASVLFTLEYSMLFDMLLLLLLFVFLSLHHNESIWNHQPIGILSCCCGWCRCCCCPPGSKFLRRSSHSHSSVENQRVDRVCSVAVGRCSMTMIGDDWPILAQDYGFLVYKLMLILIMWLGLNIAGPFNW